MEILRTDGQGATYNNQRLEIVKNIVEYFSYDHIELLHDHKGTLIVCWSKEPTKNEKEHLLRIWEVMAESEIEHKLITYIDL